MGAARRGGHRQRAAGGQAPLLYRNSSLYTVTPIMRGVIRNGLRDDPETVKSTGIYRNLIRHRAEV